MSVLQLDDIEQMRYLQWEWLGRDLLLVEGDLAFGSDGDLLAHTEPILSFADVLRYKSQVAAALVQDVFPYRIHVGVQSAVSAVRADPRVGSVKILGGEWRVIDATAVPPKVDNRFYVVYLRVTLTNGDTVDNLVLPIRAREAS